MAATNEDIANSALSKLGADEIVSLSSDTSRRAKLANRQFAKTRSKLLRSHPWNFAMKRQFLLKVTDITDSVVFATDTFTTKAAAALNAITGDRVTLTLNSGTLPEPLQESRTYFMIKLTGTTFKLAETQANAQTSTAVDISDAPVFDLSLEVGPPFEFDNKYFIPSDMLRAVREDDKSIDWKIEEQLLVTSEDEFNLLYIADITDPTKFDESFDELFALTLAYELSYPLVQSLSLKQQLKVELDEVLRDTRSFDAQEGFPEDFEANEWLIARQ